MELLSPAGSFESLRAAVSAGCDAVYLGSSFFANARMNAANFDRDELIQAIDYCHLRDVKTYVTVNTLLTDREIGQLYDYGVFLYENNADAVLVQDLGVASFLKRNIPELEIHASTQMGICNLDGVRFAEKIGCSRAVVARELSASNIEHICKNSNIEIEAFVHGAMCASASGFCLMSSFIGRRSGNRGKCAQPCRLKYSTGNKEGYLMSLKDMMLIEHIDSLKKSGVASLKIEGRMKSPGYVGCVTEIYRKAIDGEKITDADISRLKNAFDRGGYTDSYYTEGKNFFAFEKPETTYGHQMYDVPEKKTEIGLSMTAKIGSPITITAKYKDISVEKTGEFICETALKRAVSEDDAKLRIKKLGDTAFVCDEPEVLIDDSLMVPLGEITSLRRDVVCKLAEKITEKKKFSGFLKPLNVNSFRNEADYKIAVSVENVKQYQSVTYADRIYVPLWVIYNNQDAFSKVNSKIVVLLPQLCYDDKSDLKQKMISRVKEMGYSAFCASNAGDIEISEYTDYSVWMFNSECVNYLRKTGIKTGCLSPEINIAQLKDIRSDCGLEAIIYGKIPVMLSKNCFVKSAGNCGDCTLRDRTGGIFKAMCCPDFGYTRLLNTVPLYMGDKISDFDNTCIDTLRLMFTDESPSECERIIELIKSGKSFTGDYTRGHYYRGV